MARPGALPILISQRNAWPADCSETSAAAGGMKRLAARSPRLRPTARQFVLGVSGTIRFTNSLSKDRPSHPAKDFNRSPLFRRAFRLVLVSRKDLPACGERFRVRFRLCHSQSAKMSLHRRRRLVEHILLLAAHSCRLGSTSRTCHIAAARRRCRTWWLSASILWHSHAARARGPLIAG